MRVTAFFATTSFYLIMEFNAKEYRLLDIKQFLKNEKGKLAELCNDDMFQTAKLDRKAGTVVWENGVDFDPEILFQASVSIDRILGNEGE